MKYLLEIYFIISPLSSFILKLSSTKLVDSANSSTEKLNIQSKQIFDSPADLATQNSPKIKSNAHEAVKTKITPVPRSTGRIEVKFTPRVFPTPVRESQEQNEKEVF